MKYEILKDKTLALFFTTGVSLKLWREIGMLDREVAIYNELSRYFKRIYFFTYGKNDLGFKNYLADNIIVIPKKYVSNNLLYSFALPLIHRKILREVDILKTNQMLGSWSAVLAKLIYRKRLVVRTGYMLSIHFMWRNSRSPMRWVIKGIERLAYKAADGIINSSQADMNFVKKHYSPAGVHVLIPNYVETDKFKPMPVAKKKGSICFIGRLSREKNLFALLEALVGLPYTIDLIGSGKQKEQLTEFANRNRVNASFLGNFPNEELPQILNEYELFILPSLWEGMPKTLLEAMSCGLPAISTRVYGATEVIEHGKNGILCDTDSASIRQAILSVMEEEGLKQKLGEEARATIEQGFSLAKLFDRELRLYEQLLTQGEAKDGRT